MKKYVRFSDIPKGIEAGEYECAYSLTSFVKHIEEMTEEYGLQMNPDFQRGHVWSEDQQIAYMEALLANRARNAQTFYFNDPNWMVTLKNNDYAEFVCVDGLQRYTAIKRFVDNEIKVYGSYFKDFVDKVSVGDLQLKFNVNSLKTKEEVLRWYVEMNTGGTPHAEEEIERVKSMIDQLRKA